MTASTQKKSPNLSRGGKTSREKSAKSRKGNGKAKNATPDVKVAKGSPRKGEYVLKNVPLKDLVSKMNPREHIGDISELKTNVRAHGIIHPLVVRPKGPTGERLEVIVGGRRLHVAHELKLLTVPVIIRYDLKSDLKALALAVSENAGDVRTALSPMDQARAYKRLTDADKKASPSKIGKLCGCSGQHVRLMLRLIEAPKSVRDALAKGDLKSGAAVAVASLPDEVRDRVIRDLHLGMTEAEVRTRANDIARELGADANPNRSSGKASASTGGGAYVVTRSRSEINRMADDLVGEIMEEEADKNDATEAKYALATIFWYFNRLKEIEIKSRDFKKAYDDIAKDLELVEE